MCSLKLILFFFINQLEDINWRLNIRMADSTQAKMHEPNAVLELGIRDDETKVTLVDSTLCTERITIGMMIC